MLFLLGGLMGLVSPHLYLYALLALRNRASRFDPRHINAYR
jgi:hypothetical protein